MVPRSGINEGGANCCVEWHCRIEQSRKSHGTLQAAGRWRKQDSQAQGKKANTSGKGAASFGLPNISQEKKLMVDSILQRVVLADEEFNDPSQCIAVP